MFKNPIIFFTVGISLLCTQAGGIAETVFTIDYETTTDFVAQQGRLYTTFSSGDAFIEFFASTNSNVRGVNPGPGFAYFPTGVSFEPDMVYSIDFLVGDNPGQSDFAVVEYGLFSGLPSDDMGPGEADIYFGGPFEASVAPSLGQIGRLTIRNLGSTGGFGNSVLASELSGTTHSDRRFVFVTGNDVSELGEMVIFMRCGVDGTAINRRAHWDRLTLTKSPVVELLGDVNLDRSVDLLDVEPFVDVLTSGQFQVEADVNFDCKVNLLDVSIFVELILGS